MDDIQWGMAGGSDDNKETVNQNIILINRQRQVKIKIAIREALKKTGPISFMTSSQFVRIELFFVEC